MNNEIEKRKQTLPDTIQELKKYIDLSKARINAHQARLRAAEVLKDQELAKEWIDKAKIDGRTAVAETWQAEAKLGELLGPGEEAIKRGTIYPSTQMEGLSHHDRHAARRFHEAQECGICDTALNEAEEKNVIPNYTEPFKMLKEQNKENKKKERKNKYEEKSKFFKSDDIKIFNQDFYEYSKNIDDNSIDLIITDPPYPKEFLPQWEKMFEVANKILKPSKFLICYANHQNLNEIFKLKNELIYYWIFKIDFTMKPIAKGRNIIATWKPILLFQKPPFKKIEDTIEDTIKFDYTERDLHDKNWGQTIAPFEYLIEKFTEPNNLIFEPFAGTGTTLIAAKNKARKCIGCEIDKQYIDLIKGRLI
jgi:hypothetical protein